MALESTHLQVAGQAIIADKVIKNFVKKVHPPVFHGQGVMDVCS